MSVITNSIKELNDKYFNSIKRILIKNAHIFSEFIEATPKQDMEDGFDSIFRFNDIKIPIRIRKYVFAEKYRDVTIRSKARYGSRTEIDKIRDGYGDYYFYAWENKDSTSIYCYLIFDIKKFISANIVNNPSASDIPNGDGTYFNSYNISEMIKKDVIIIYEKFNL